MTTSAFPTLRPAAWGAAALLALSAPLAQAVGGPPGAGWVEIAHFNGTTEVTAATYVNGVGSLAAANYAEASGHYAALLDHFTLAVVMGTTTDYFKPRTAAVDLTAMLTSHNNHVWSANALVGYVAPAYATSNLGGSAFGWPADGRVTLPFWGTTTFQLGGCCQTGPGALASWGQAFSLYLLPAPAVPEPASALLALGGLAVLGWRARRRPPTAG